MLCYAVVNVLQGRLTGDGNTFSGRSCRATSCRASSRKAADII